VRRPKTLTLAHRGDWTGVPENSLAAFRAAARRPDLDGVEFDVRAARGGTPVVIHDADLGRVQGVRRAVGDLTVEELGAAGVPTLQAVLEVLPDRMFLDVELKEDVGVAVVPLVARLRGDPPRNVVISSFRPEILRTVRDAAPTWPCWLIHRGFDAEVLRTAVALGCRGLAIEWPALDPAGVDAVRRAGLQLATWTVEDRSTLHSIGRLGVDAICIDPFAQVP
jgi:glycerophosphoryl diester phosphodiesterase